MAGSPIVSLVVLGAVGGTIYAGATGKLPSGLQLAWNKSLGGIAQAAPPGVVPSPVPAPSPAPGPPCDTSFIPGQRYVAAYANGYTVVVGGQQVGFFTDLTTAQNYYNQQVCGHN